MVGMTMKRALVVATTAVGLGVVGMADPAPAQACGGTFCDGGPAPMPVEQTGETILFVFDGAYVEAHIQIQYDPNTEAEQFAWIVPVTALPEFSVGSQRLFGNLLGATVPAYGLGNNNEPCGFDTGGFDDGCDGSGGAADEGGVFFDLGGPPPKEPEVVLATTVGAFEVFVLDGGSVDGVMQWLGDNGFQQDMAAAPILEEYLNEGHLFVAFRLTAQAEVGEIHPIALRYAGTEPCVPIRLTRIAAQEDMEIRALFLADGRMSSSNYRHVTLNPLKLDWMGLGINYREVVTMAVDEPGADGHAFVTEYAGGSELVPRDGLLGPLWDSVPFVTAADPAEAVLLLLEQELYAYDDFGECVPANPLVEALMARYLPTPPEVPPSSLCGDPATFAMAVDAVQWDGPAFAADLEDRVIAPGLHANDLLDTWPYLTRLYTTLSPNEMTSDPMFHATPELPEQTTLTQVGTLNTFCDGDASFSLPDGRLVALLDPFDWPDIAPDEMPWVETIEHLPAAGAPVIEVDHRETIEMLLAAWNEQYGPPRSPASGSCHGEDTGGTTGGGTGGLTSGAFTNGTDGDAGSAMYVEGGGSGCACRGAGAGPEGAMLALLGLLGLRRRRGQGRG
jgi:MYXO-CTERM domain-containing protein